MSFFGGRLQGRALCRIAQRLRPPAGARACLALVLGLAAAFFPPTASGLSSSPWSSQGGRALYRITPGRYQNLFPLLALGLDVAGAGPRGSLDVILKPEELASVRALGFTPVPLDLTPRGVHAAAESPLAKPGLGAYHTYSEALSEMEAYAAAHPATALLETIGTSIEGRPIPGIKISDGAAAEEGEPQVLVVGCHHARELMSVELPLYLMRRLLDGYGVDPTITALVDEREIWIVPILNPDGYVYVESHATGQSDGWWRKNRRANGDGTFGVDLNRNYGYLWGYDNIGSSPTTSSEVYRGTGPFSEPETAAIRDFMASRAFTIGASFHSYGELFLWPWGYQREDTPDQPVFRAFGDSISAQNGYLAGNAASGAIYVTNGDLDDWLYGDTAWKPRVFGFTFELNTADEGGFSPPDQLIGPTCELNWGPLLTLLRYGDGPRRVLPPARPSEPGVGLAGGGPALMWSYPAPDPSNPPVRHDLRMITSLTVGPDDAEAGVADWEATGFTWSSARSAGGTHSYYSGSGDARISVLAARAPIEVRSASDSLVTTAWWDLEPLADFWYAEASADGGATWALLAGNRTTILDPYGTNLGEGVTGSSGAFLHCSFSLGAYAGSQVLVRFRCITDGAVHGEGLYLDDITPVAHESGVSILDTASSDTVYVLSPPPEAPSWYQVRAVDAEGQPGRWSDRSRFDPTFTAVESGPPSGATRIEIAGANPFHPAGGVRYALPAGFAGAFRVDAFDVHGRLVRGLAEGLADGRGGSGTLRWDGTDDRGVPLGSGIYLLRLTTARGRAAAKITLIR